MQSPSQEERACHDFDRQATEELPNFLPYAAVDNTDELEERYPVLACKRLLRLMKCLTPAVEKQVRMRSETFNASFLPWKGLLC